MLWLRRLVLAISLLPVLWTAFVQQSAAQEPGPFPGAVRLGVPYPNPAQDRVAVPFRTSRPAFVTVEVHDLTGRRVLHSRQFVQGGRHEILVDLGDSAAGLYLVRAFTGERGSSAVSFVRTARSGGSAGISIRDAGSGGFDADPDLRPEIADSDEVRAGHASACALRTCSPAASTTRPDSLVNSVGMWFTRVPKAEYTMGSVDGPGDERPVRSVRLTRDVWVARTEVTRARFTEVLGGAAPGSAAATDVRPVTGVSWFDAVGFANALSRIEGYPECYVPGGEVLSGAITECEGYRLPTEAEWEFMARAGTATAWSFGDDASRIGEFAWYADNSSFGVRGTRGVGVKRPNRWGIHDVHGNAWEWVHDRYGSYDDGSRTDPRGPTEGLLRVIRGGSYLSSPSSMRSTGRGSMDPVGRNPGVGFRIVRTADGPALPGGPPSEPSDPAPQDGRRGVSPAGSLSWFAADRDGDEVTFDVYFGTEEPLPLVASGLVEPTLPIPPTNDRTTYRWRVEVSDGRWAIEGPLWTFTTGPEPGAHGLPTMRNSLGMEFVLIPPGKFVIGDINYTRYDVTLTREFWIGVYETTRSEYDRVMGAVPPGGDDRLPVQNVTWLEAVQFANALSVLEGAEVCYGADFEPIRTDIHSCRGYRLPTQAEWEYATRAGTTGPWSFGDDESRLGEHAWYAANSGGVAHAVGWRLPNPWGLHDMHGNVREWTHDRYTNFLGRSRTDPILGGGWSKGVRGGSFRSEAGATRSGAESSLDRDARRDDVGIRLIRGSTALNRPPGVPYGPSPSHGALNLELDSTTLTWQAVDPDDDPLGYEVYFGTSWPPPLAQAFTTHASFETGPLAANTHYYWRVVARDGPDRTTGPDWVFLTGNGSPAEPLARAINGWGMELLRVPAGTFKMGSLVGHQTARWPHQVTLTHDFWLQRFETTQAEYVRVTGMNPSLSRSPDRPVETVTWLEATRFANTVSVKQGFEACYAADGSFRPGDIYTCTGYRLPTEAEFEYAARAGTSTEDWFGDAASMTRDFAWVDSNSDRNLQPVGRMPPNPWGFFDLLGNVGEFAHDGTDLASFSADPVVDPVLGLAAVRRMYRGGSIRTTDTYPLTSVRWAIAPDESESYVGFRLARTAFEERGANLPPNAAVSPYPVDRSVVRDLDTLLEWQGSDPEGDPVTYDLYFGTTDPPPPIARGLTESVFDPGTLDPSTVYFWHVVTADGEGHSPAVEWRFITDGPPVDPPLARTTGPMGMDFVRLPHGHFEMGSEATGERPVRRVVLSHDVWMGVREVTQAEYKAMLGTNPSRFTATGQHPVDGVTRLDAIRFVNALSRSEGLVPCYDASGSAAGDPYDCEGYRLPTEAEWEYGARAGTSGDTFFSGTGTGLEDFAWFSGNSAGTGTREVARGLANPWGLFDIYGNVQEWVDDHLVPYDPAEAWDPVGRGTRDTRVVRGGSWTQGVDKNRSASRVPLSGGVSLASVGFRVARTAR